MTNEQTRKQAARSARKTLRKHASFRDEPKCSVTDALADLMHFCDHDDIDFDDALRIARNHFDDERSVEKPESHSNHTETPQP